MSLKNLLVHKINCNICFLVCFSVSDYKNCTEARDAARNGTGDSIYENAIYHMGKCVTNQTDFEKIRSNLTHFYACKLEDKETGVFLNETECVSADRASEITELFDIPNGIRKTGNNILPLKFLPLKLLSWPLIGTYLRMYLLNVNFIFTLCDSTHFIWFISSF